MVEGLRGAIAARCPKDDSAVLFFLAWTRLRCLSVRFSALATAVRNGRLGGRRRARPTFRRLPPAFPPFRPFPLPRGFGWALPLVPEAAEYRSDVQDFLDEPELAELLAAVPQAGGILRSLCRMLGIAPSPALVLARCQRPEFADDPAVCSPAPGSPAPSGGPPPDPPSWPPQRPLMFWSDDELASALASLKPA